MGGSAWQQIDGVLLLDKPEGLSSNAALQRTRRLLGAAKAGHTGTLDPLATGLLPICLGEATKFAQGLLDADKGYLATARLGVTTDTGDREGRVLQERPVAVDAAAIREVLAGLTGAIEQVPPMYSALKHQGRPLYAIARAGGEVHRAARQVRILQLDLVEWVSPLLRFAVRCSKGTYVRTLAEEIGERLATGAHLVALRRTSVGPFTLDAAVSLDTLEAASPEARAARILAPDTLVQALPAVCLDSSEARSLLQGCTLAARARSVRQGSGRAAGSTDPVTDLGAVPTADQATDPTLAAAGALFRSAETTLTPFSGPALATAGELVRVYASTPVEAAGLAPPAPGALGVFLGMGRLAADGELRAVRLIAHQSPPKPGKTVIGSPGPAETA